MSSAPAPRPVPQERRPVAPPSPTRPAGRLRRLVTRVSAAVGAANSASVPF